MQHPQQRATHPERPAPQRDIAAIGPAGQVDLPSPSDKPREDPEHLSFPPEVYQQRLDQYKERIQSMLHYVESDDTCRSRLLLSYFGETDAKDCGQCDVCRSSREAAVIPTPSRDEVCRQILTLLDEGGAPLPLPTLHRLALPTEAIDDALRHLTQEELVLIEDGYLRKA